MDIREYIRKTAEKNGWVKYYSTERPVSIGGQPARGFMDFINYDDRTEINGRMAWAELFYDRELTEKEMQDYELVRA